MCYYRNMKNLLYLLLLVLTTQAIASANNVEILKNQWETERTARANSIEWIGGDRIESRDNIQNKLISKIYEGKFSEAQIEELIRNSRVSVESIKYVELNKNKIINNSGCISESCNKVLWEMYVKKSDEFYVSKKF